MTFIFVDICAAAKYILGMKKSTVMRHRSACTCRRRTRNDYR